MSSGCGCGCDLSVQSCIDLGKGVGRSEGDGAVGDVPSIFDMFEIGWGSAVDGAGVDCIRVGWIAAFETLSVTAESAEELEYELGVNWIIGKC